MKKMLIALTLLVPVLVFMACGDSASGASENNSASSKGSFPANGDPDFYCEVTKGEGWVQMKVNIPNYKGIVEKVGYDSSTDTGTQYYEESYFNLTSVEKAEMCLEYDRDIKNDKDRKLTDYYCGKGVFYMLGTVKNASRYMEEFEIAEEGYEQDCKRYEREWEEGEYDEIIERRM